ncbi:hypothetical protein ANN_26393 [Periplaneta americana]|uniref:Uncharacterized protein n=1 Tax=Periplaneta americana TaxID=6978 RepID=A0ABQ8RY44_PERAM|nr:hypothetical protein ANN_26393 [Periplaneta americana]
MAGLCEGGNEPPGSLKANNVDSRFNIANMYKNFLRDHPHTKKSEASVVCLEASATVVLILELELSSLITSTYTFDFLGLGCRLIWDMMGSEDANNMCRTSSKFLLREHFLA